jgi:hypothetical protein
MKQFRVPSWLPAGMLDSSYVQFVEASIEPFIV